MISIILTQGQHLWPFICSIKEAFYRSISSNNDQEPLFLRASLLGSTKISGDST